VRSRCPFCTAWFPNYSTKYVHMVTCPLNTGDAHAIEIISQDILMQAMDADKQGT